MSAKWLLFFLSLASISLQLQGEIYIPKKAKEYAVNWYQSIKLNKRNEALFSLNQRTSLSYLNGFSAFSPDDDVVFTFGIKPVVANFTHNQTFTLTLGKQSRPNDVRVEIHISPEHIQLQSNIIGNQTRVCQDISHIALIIYRNRTVHINEDYHQEALGRIEADHHNATLETLNFYINWSQLETNYTLIFKHGSLAFDIELKPNHDTDGSGIPFWVYLIVSACIIGIIASIVYFICRITKKSTPKDKQQSAKTLTVTFAETPTVEVKKELKTRKITIHTNTTETSTAPLKEQLPPPLSSQEKESKDVPPEITTSSSKVPSALPTDSQLPPEQPVITPPQELLLESTQAVTPETEGTQASELKQPLRNT